MRAFQVELKICEACGTLWLRAAGQGVYCGRCAVWLAEFPAPRGCGGQHGKRRGRKPLVARSAANQGGLRLVQAGSGGDRGSSRGGGSQ